VTVWLEPGLYDDLDRVAARMGLGLPALFRRATVGYAFVWRHLRKWWGLDLFVLLLVLGLFAPGGRC
jgi:hypothetical protein